MLEKLYIESLSAIFDQYNIETVIYDETEYFYDWKQPGFDYPFTNRKSVVSTYKIKVSDLVKLEGTNYEFINSNIKF